MLQTLLALTMTLALAFGLIYFVHDLWPVLPGWAAMLVFILIAVIIIGYPIYTLAQWSNRSWQRTLRERKKNG